MVSSEISVEDKFERDVLLAETETMIRGLAAKLWSASRKVSLMARTERLQDSHPQPYGGISALFLGRIDGHRLEAARGIDLGPEQRYRVVGVGLSNFQEPDDTAAQPVLF